MKKLTFLFLVCLSVTASAQEIGLQLYSLRNEMPKDVPGTLAKIKKWGIKNLEGGGTYGMTIPEFKKLLDANNMKMLSVAADFSELIENPMAAVERAKAFGATYVVCYWIPHEGTDFSIAEAKKGIEVFNAAGKVMKENGISFCYHPHGYEFRPLQGGTVFDYMMKYLDPDFVNFEMDVFWVKHPGQDPVALLKKYPNRFVLMHLKDRKQGTVGNQNGQADVESNVVLGSGDVGIASIMEEAQTAGVKYFFLEDESSRVEKQVPLSLLYLKSLR